MLIEGLILYMRLFWGPFRRFKRSPLPRILSSIRVLHLFERRCPPLQVGMRYFNKRTNKYFNPIINLDKLWALVGEEVGLLAYPSTQADH